MEEKNLSVAPGLLAGAVAGVTSKGATCMSNTAHEQVQPVIVLSMVPSPDPFDTIKALLQVQGSVAGAGRRQLHTWSVCRLVCVKLRAPLKPSP
jgi:hypothetical protein